MEVMYVAKKIEEKVRLLERGRTELNDLTTENAKALAEYDKAIALTMVRLRNGQAFTLGEETIQDPPATLIDKIARGVCWEEKLAASEAEANMKICIEKLRCVQAELNGYQSIYKHLAAM